ncbi:DUF6531 domain-containing protein [Aquabacterium sp. A7-Y]|uniref:RHS repeat-associated core domain-containing protein n=1 Tax=Aquabacterium sp. A7-Y TaxID=1349605 RepID=UPI00223DAEC2|nr:RHS repeat-associated core domain-containing protein [Aquabacterium sp. A7-Y]MCW7536941.1 DUF6531 domain-containing protein [Aquabacterium sp. A7-Y]
MMPSAKHGDPQLGVDIHLCVVPPSPSPVPLPTPHLSVVFDPFDYVPIIGATVSVFGMKRATAGTGAIVVHIPPGFPFAPMLPDKDDELFMGSSTVLADGDPLSYLALPVLGCQVAGMPSPPRPKKKRISPPRLLPTTFNLAIPTTVRVGGAPTISMMGMAAKGAFAGLGKLRKSKFARNLGDRFRNFRRKLFKNMDRGFLKCKVLRAEPVNILTGEVVVEQVDFTLPGRIPIEWVRSYSSSSRRRGACGYGWESPADARLEIDREDGSVMFRHPSEGVALFPNLPLSPGDTGAVLELMDGALLSDHGDEFRVRLKSRLLYHFPKALAITNDQGVSEVPLRCISDLCGNWLQFERHEGKLRAIRESSGRHILVEQHLGQVRSLSLFVPESGFSHSFVDYEYDQAGDLTAVRDALGHPYCFAYDRHHMVRHTNRTGLSFYYEYDTTDENWRVVHAWGDGGLYDYRFAYWPEIHETRITDSLGHVSTVQCDQHGLPILEIDPQGGRTIFEYDEAGRTTSIVDAANHRTACLHDERGNLRKLTRPDGSTVAIDVNENNQVTRIEYPGGASWLQSWDSRGLLVRQTSPLGAVTTYEYDTGGLPVCVTDACQASTRFSFDTDGYLVAVIDALGHVTRLQRDELGNLLARSDPLGFTTHYRYDRKSRLTETTLPGGARIHCRYDAQDLLTSYEDESGARTRFEYFGQGLVKKRYQPDGHVVEYHHDTEEQLIGVSNQRGETYRLRRDALGRVVEEVDYWGQSTAYSFDPAGHLRQSCDPLGRIVSYTTDQLGRIRRKAFAHPEHPGREFEETFDFDANGHLTGCANEHVRVQRRFDLEGRLLEERQGEFFVRNTFDAMGRRVRRETSAGNTVVYSYDALGQAATIQVNDEPPITIERDAGGQVRKETLGQTLDRYYQYDARGRLTAQGLKQGAHWLFHSRYEYDPTGNLTRRQDSHHGTDQYRYDPLGQIVEHMDPRGRLTRFFQDPAGDRLQTQVLEQAGQQVVDGVDIPGKWLREGRYDGVYYRFDRAGNLVQRSDEGRCALIGAAGRTTILTWDANQRLVRSLSNGIATAYGYDPLGRRVFKQTGATGVRFFWDSDVIAGEQPFTAQPSPGKLRENDAFIPGASMDPQPAARCSPPPPREYVCYPGTFRPVALVEAQSTTGERCCYYYHNDPNGYPVRLTSGSGEVKWAASAATWGEAEIFSGAAVFNPIRFQGQYADEETGLHYNRYRYYDPHAGQFVGQDPIRLLGGPNPYAYATNPLVWSDPWGLICQRLARTLPQGPGVYHIELNGQFYTGSADNVRVRLSQGDHPAAALLNDPNVRVTVHPVNLGSASGNRRMTNHVLRGYEQGVMDNPAINNIPLQNGSLNQIRAAKVTRVAEYAQDAANHGASIGPGTAY